MNDRRLYQILLGSHTTEKSVEAAAGGNRCITFKVARDSNKIEIKKAVEKIFNVVVTKVATINMKDKTRIFKQKKGRCSGFKKALVFLKEGHDINMAEFE